MFSKRRHNRVVSCDLNKENAISIPTSIGKDTSHWSFCKAPRFRNFKIENSEMYNLPTTFNKRSCSFGYGRRYELKSAQGKDSPAPGAYNPPTCFELAKRAPSFGKRSLSGVPQNLPGPGAYNPYSPIGKKAPKFSFSPRIEIKYRASSPPPDTYNPVYRLVENSSFSDISFGKGEKGWNILPKVEEKPGPGSYDLPSAFRSNTSFDVYRPPMRGLSPQISARRASEKET
ncbi:unnamed protein product [Blepharisma stoltei]|uniref:Uncharacterized protein n=1 Tax=Blepharisma stoltei TaxID=1481888 RepID=A0AAU9JZQ2_9CILI|nr:unnamed protein product [Blepharisma stoltei]